MSLRIWIYFFKHALLNISNNRLIHFISISTIAISMLLFGSFILLYVNLNDRIKGWGESLSMSVYLEDGLDNKSIESIEKSILEIEGAEIKEFISKEQAMNILKASLGNQAGLLDGLTKNPLPSSFEILIKDAGENKIEPKKIAMSLGRIEGVEDVRYSEQWVERFETVIYMFRLVGFIVGGLLCIAVLFITTNTIKLTIYSRRDEIEIYKLVGATDWFVKIPFLIEGTIQGIAGALSAFLILLLAYSAISFRSFQVFEIPVFDIAFISKGHCFFLIILGSVLGFVGGLIAISRFFEP